MQYVVIGTREEHRGHQTMYEYRILFPRLGSQVIRRQVIGDPRVDDRRRPEGAYRPERRTSRERS